MLTYRVDAMADTPEIPRPSQLWKGLSPERKLQAAEAFWQDENAAAEQAEAIVLIAQRIKFRRPARMRFRARRRRAICEPRRRIRRRRGASTRRVSPALSASDDGDVSRCPRRDA
jgi:hypothetical protein